MSDVVMCPECSGCGHIGWADAPEMCLACWGRGDVPRHLFELGALNELSEMDDEDDSIPF